MRSSTNWRPEPSATRMWCCIAAATVRWRRSKMRAGIVCCRSHWAVSTTTRLSAAITAWCSTAGRCTYMPAQKTINPSACVRAYPAVERHRLVWLWPGDPALADPAKVPDFHWNDGTDWVGEGGTFYKLGCDYRLVVDNLMDLTHRLTSMSAALVTKLLRARRSRSRTRTTPRPSRGG
jgi:hypothetical protein